MLYMARVNEKIDWLKLSQGEKWCERKHARFLPESTCFEKYSSKRRSFWGPENSKFYFANDSTDAIHLNTE